MFHTHFGTQNTSVLDDTDDDAHEDSRRWYPAHICLRWYWWRCSRKLQTLIS